MKKIILFIGMIIIGFFAIIGLYFYLERKDEAREETENVIQETTLFQPETEILTSEPVPVPDPKEAETAAPSETEETLIYNHPEEFPEEEPLPEIYGGEVEGIEIHIYFTNMETVDSSGLLPYNAWENTSKQLQMFLNFEELEVYEVQAIDNSIEENGDVITFYAMFPELPEKRLKLDYDIRLRNWTFFIEEDIENEIEEHSSGDNFE